MAPSKLALSTLRGSDSRLPPHSDDGARARTDASVSKDRRRRRLDEEASVRIEALSVNRLLAVAVAYVVGWPVVVPDGVRCAGMADAGDVVGNGWSKWMTWEPGCSDWWPFAVVLVWFGAPLGATDCIVVSVVVRDRTDGAGDENVLSPPLRESTPQPTVRLVPATDDVPCEGAIIECDVSCSVEIVGATDRPPKVGGAWPSEETRMDSFRAEDVMLEDLLVRPVVTEGWLCCARAPSPMLPDWEYGLLFCDWRFLMPPCFEACRPPSPDDAAFRFASFFISVEKGRRRPGRADRSAMLSVASKGLSGGAELRLRKGAEKCGMAATASGISRRTQGRRRRRRMRRDAGRMMDGDEEVQRRGAVPRG